MPAKWEWPHRLLHFLLMVIPRHATHCERFEYTLWLVANVECCLVNNSAFAISTRSNVFRSTRNRISGTESHTIIYLQQLYRLFITGSLPTCRPSMEKHTLSEIFTLRKRFRHTHAHKWRRNEFSPFYANNTITVELHFPISLRHSALTGQIGSASCRHSVVQCALSIVYAFLIRCRSTDSKNKKNLKIISFKGENHLSDASNFRC